MNMARVRFPVAAVLAVAVAVTAIAVATEKVSADAYGYPNPGYVHDSLDHWYCFDSTFVNNRAYVNDAMGYLDATTNLYDVYTPTCGTSTDAVWINVDLGGPLGYTPCVRWVNQATHVCDQFWVIIDEAAHWDAVAYCGGDANQLVGNYVISVRHELGHTAGLSHFAPYGAICGDVNPLANDAMVSDWVTGNPWPYVVYSTHHIGHVNCKCGNP